MNYSIPDNVDITEATHGNAKNNPTVFRPTQYSLKKELTERLGSTKEPPRIILDSYDKNQAIFEETAFVRNKKQIYNFKCNNLNAEANKDPLLDIIKEIISSGNNHTTLPLDKDQAYVRERLIRNEEKPSILMYLGQNSRVIERLCSNKASILYFSALSADDTYNISNRYLIQTVCENLAVVKRDTEKSPWFPGPSAFVRNLLAEEHRWFWHSSIRGNKNLVNVRLLGTDGDKALHSAILKECSSLTFHVLGYKHMKKPLEDKLNDLLFPKSQSRKIVNDI